MGDTVTDVIFPLFKGWGILPPLVVFDYSTFHFPEIKYALLLHLLNKMYIFDNMIHV